MVSLIVPTFGGNIENLKRTADSCSGICDELVVISTAVFLEDQNEIKKVADKVVQLPFNYTFRNGFGDMMNQGSDVAKNDWLLLLGVAETFAEPHRDVHQALKDAPPNAVFRCNHVNDPHTWKRIWNRKGGTQWGGLIHEEIGGGIDGGLLFRFQDTDKTPKESPLENQCMMWMKALLYNYLYRKLLNNPNLLGYTDPGWIKFVQGASDSINDYCERNAEMLDCCVKGDYHGFVNLVEKTMDSGRKANGVSFTPTGS